MRVSFDYAAVISGMVFTSLMGLFMAASSRMDVSEK